MTERRKIGIRPTGKANRGKENPHVARFSSLLRQPTLIFINSSAGGDPWTATSRGAAITWPRGTAVISRGVSAEGRNAIICRLYATIIARAHSAERRRNRQRDPIKRPRWAPQRVAPVRNRIFPPSLPSPSLPGCLSSWPWSLMRACACCR